MKARANRIADAQFVELVGRGGFLGVGQGFYLFKPAPAPAAAELVRARGDGRTVRNGGGRNFGVDNALKLRVELLDFGFEGGNLVGERARAVVKRVVFFLRGPNTTISAPH